MVDLYVFAEAIANKQDFVLSECIKKGEYYDPKKIRNLIFEGVYQGHQAVLKVYSDPRPRDDGPAQEAFNKVNKSDLLIAPEVYRCGVVSPFQGWLIMEELPEGSFLKPPLPQKERDGFLKLYLEYRQNSPKTPHRSLSLIEKLSSYRFCEHSIHRWMELANNRELELSLEEKVLNPEEFIPRFNAAMRVIEENFRDKEMIWCANSLMRTHQVFKVVGQKKYYLLDFSRAGMRPEGYELAVIIWGDWIIEADWHLDYSEWKKGIFEWLDLMRRKYQFFGFRDTDTFDSIMKASLTERILGAILADVVAVTSRPREEKEARISLLYKLLDEIITGE